MPARGRRGEKGGEKWASENRKMCVMYFMYMYIHMKGFAKSRRDEILSLTKKNTFWRWMPPVKKYYYCDIVMHVCIIHLWQKGGPLSGIQAQEGGRDVGGGLRLLKKKKIVFSLSKCRNKSLIFFCAPWFPREFYNNGYIRSIDNQIGLFKTVKIREDNNEEGYVCLGN